MTSSLTFCWHSYWHAHWHLIDVFTFLLTSLLISRWHFIDVCIDICYWHVHWHFQGHLCRQSYWHVHWHSYWPFSAHLLHEHAKTQTSENNTLRFSSESSNSATFNENPFVKMENAEELKNHYVFIKTVKQMQLSMRILMWTNNKHKTKLKQHTYAFHQNRARTATFNENPCVKMQDMQKGEISSMF